MLHLILPLLFEDLPVDTSQSPRILVIDGHPYSRLATLDILQLDRHEVVECDGDGDLLAIVESIKPDLVLLDMAIPHNNALDVCQMLKQSPQTAIIPVILTTALDQTVQRQQSREVGADAYLLKPLERIELLTRVDLLIQKKRLSEWVDQIEGVLFRVAEVVEERRKESGSQVSFRQNAIAFSEYLKLQSSAQQDLVFAARLHDIGTVAIPETILLKPDRLSDTERELIKEHVIVGEKIFEPLAYRREVGRIMRHHHERWDGTGYPDGLKGEEIPYLAQVFQILDIYHALTNYRSYKAAVSPLEAIAILQEEASQGWRNPELVEQFAKFISQSEELISLSRQVPIQSLDKEFKSG